MATILSLPKDLVVLIASLCLEDPNELLALSTVCRQWRAWLFARPTVLSLLHRRIEGFATLHDVPQELDQLVRFLRLPVDAVSLSSRPFLRGNTPTWGNGYTPDRMFFEPHRGYSFGYCTASGFYENALVQALLRVPVLCSGFVEACTAGGGYSRPCEDALVWLRTERELPDLSAFFGATEESLAAMRHDLPDACFWGMAEREQRGLPMRRGVLRPRVVRAVQVLLLRPNHVNTNIDMGAVRLVATDIVWGEREEKRALASAISANVGAGNESGGGNGGGQDDQHLRWATYGEDDEGAVQAVE
jgi:hypothetical protein